MQLPPPQGEAAATPYTQQKSWYRPWHSKTVFVRFGRGQRTLLWEELVDASGSRDLVSVHHLDFYKLVLDLNGESVIVQVAACVRLYEAPFN